MPKLHGVGYSDATERMAKRLKAMKQPNYVNGFKLTMHEHVIEKPLEWKTPQVIFINSMIDLFHKDVPLEFIQRVFGVMKRAHWHQFHVLTKRSGRVAELSPHLEWADNIWMGVSVENKDYVYRVNDLGKTGAKIKFLSVESLLGPIPKMNLKGINWVIVGGESGPGARPLEREWAIGVRDHARRLKPHFSSSNGVLYKRRKLADYSMAEHGMKCLER